MMPAMPSPPPAWSRAVSALVIAGAGALAWWALLAGADAGKRPALPVTRALQSRGRDPGSGPPPVTALPGVAREPVPEAEYEDILRRMLAFSRHREETGVEINEEEEAFMDSVVARVGFSARLEDLLGRASVFSLTVESGDAGYYSGTLPRAVNRALRGPAGAAWRAELVAALRDPANQDNRLRPALVLWCATAGEEAPPAEYVRLRAALARDEGARFSLERGQQTVRMRDAPVETLTALRAEYLAAAPLDQPPPVRENDPFAESMSPSLGAKWMRLLNSLPDLAAESMSPAQEAKWMRLRSLLNSLPPGVDPAAVDTVLLGIPVAAPTGGPAPWNMDIARASVLTPWALTDPGAAATWLAGHPGGSEGTGLARAVMFRLNLENQESAIAWVNGFPAGDFRDDLALEVVVIVSQADPAAARGLASGIGRADLREQALTLARERNPAGESPPPEPEPGPEPAGK